MSNSTGYRPISVVIFDRSQAGLSDVPIFSKSLKEKVNTPIFDEPENHLALETQRILRAVHGTSDVITPSVFRADSSGGQTGEFAQRTDSVASITTIADEPARLGLEDVLTAIHSEMMPAEGENRMANIPSTLPPTVEVISWASATKEVLSYLRLPRIDFVHFTSRALLAGSLVLMLLTVGPMVALELRSFQQRISYAVTTLPTRADEPAVTLPLITPSPEPTIIPEPHTQFQIIIPKIGVDSKVVANVDPANEKEYTLALKEGVAHAAGTGLPGEQNEDNKTIFIFGHSTNGAWNIAKYNALFYALKDLVIGDELTIWFWGKEYRYRARETKIVEANDLSFLSPQTGSDQLILQTCWPPGTSWKRLLVIFDPVQQ